MSETGNEINGDLSVSRGITAGGDIATKGSLEVEHDVHVKGWLIAEALKGAMRGLYVSEKSLMENNPRPRPGWYALVGDTIPAQVWVSDGTEWLPTGKTGGNLKLYSEEIAALKREVTALRLEVKSLLKDDGDGDLEQKIKDLEFEMRRYEEDRDIMSSDIADLKVDVGILKAPAG